MIRPILCEGKHDCWFLDEVVQLECSIDPLCIHKDLGEFQKCYRSDYHFSKHSCIILSDNGHELMDKYVPAIMGFFGTRILNVHFFIMKDADYSDPAYLLTTYSESMSRLLQTKRRRDISIEHDPADRTISMVSKRDDRFSFHFHFIFIPESLEKAIVEKSLEVYRSLTRGGTAIVSEDHHKALNDIACHQGFHDKEALIRHAVRERWFRDEDWYRELIRRMTSRT